MSWLSEEKEKILLFGPPKGGKTYAYLSVLKEYPDAKLFILNTDAGVQKTFKALFGSEAEKYANRVDFTYLTNIHDLPKWFEKVEKEATSKDWVVVDLISDIWEKAQDEFVMQSAKIYGGDYINYIVNASSDMKKFGLFEGTKWNWIKALYNKLEIDFLSRTPANVIAVAAEKDISVEETFVELAIKKGSLKEKPEYLDMFDKLGRRPAGSKQMPYKFDTIVYIKNQKFLVVGERGKNPEEKQYPVGDSFISKLKAWRRGELNESSS